MATVGLGGAELAALGNAFARYMCKIYAVTGESSVEHVLGRLAVWDKTTRELRHDSASGQQRHERLTEELKEARDEINEITMSGLDGGGSGHAASARTERVRAALGEAQERYRRAATEGQQTTARLWQARIALDSLVARVHGALGVGGADTEQRRLREMWAAATAEPATAAPATAAPATAEPASPAASAPPPPLRPPPSTRPRQPPPSPSRRRCDATRASAGARRHARDATLDADSQIDPRSCWYADDAHDQPACSKAATGGGLAARLTASTSAGDPPADARRRGGDGCDE